MLPGVRRTHHAEGARQKAANTENANTEEYETLPGRRPGQLQPS